MIPELEKLLQHHLQATLVEVWDDSDQHRTHAGRRDPLAAGGHYRLRVASPLFIGKSLMEQHRLVYQALQAQMGSQIHALSIQTCLPDASD
ncbi:MAG: BolA family protein [Cyanobacteriota bacterium]|nr:BolA family protein [Cyanobacteriota bacterium]